MFRTFYPSSPFYRFIRVVRQINGRTLRNKERKKESPPSVCPICYLLLNIGRNPTKSGVWVTHIKLGVQRHFFCPALWWGGVKKNLNFNYKLKSFSNNFIPKFVCVLTNKRYKTYRMMFSFFRLGHAPGARLAGARGHFFQQSHVSYQIEGDDE